MAGLDPATQGHSLTGGEKVVTRQGLLRVSATLFAFAMSWCGQAQDILRGTATLSLARESDGQVWAEFELTFRNTTGKTLCVQQGMIPGSDDFHVELIKLYGPKGELPVSEVNPHWRAPGRIVRDALLVIVIRRDQQVRQGVRFGKDDYVITDPGAYRAVYRIPLFDCAELPNLKSNSFVDDNPKWFLGDLVAEAGATLK